MNDFLSQHSISRHSILTKENNQIKVFYNPANNLLVIDLVDKNESGGTELLRITLNEEKLLFHCNIPDGALKGKE